MGIGQMSKSDHIICKANPRTVKGDSKAEQKRRPDSHVIVPLAILDKEMPKHIFSEEIPTEE